MKQWIALAALAAVSVGAQAQTFPGSKPVSIVVPFAAGGPTDRVARDLAEAMRKQIPGSNFVVENAAGAGGTIVVVVPHRHGCNACPLPQTVLQATGRL
ncbi:MAG: hypothetical protein RLZZ329_2534 [Pseudomonadota bacterium]